MPVIPTIKRQTQEDRQEFKVTLVYMKDPVSKNRGVTVIPLVSIPRQEK